MIGTSDGRQFETQFDLERGIWDTPGTTLPTPTKERTSDAPTGYEGPSTEHLAQDEHLDKKKDQSRLPIRPNPYVPQLPSPQSPNPIIPTGSFS